MNATTRKTLWSYATQKTLWQYILLLLGIGLFVAGAVSGYSWFYRLAPLRHILAPDWRKSHSPLAIWNEEQKNYLRTNASPDLLCSGDTIGYYGDKTWTLWLFENLKKGNDFRFCGCTREVLDYMTNQHIDDGRDAWIAWLQNHKEESQEQWLQQGFAKFGVTVHLPPIAEDSAPLLMLLGNNEKDAEGNVKIPFSLKYNAFRWLRDSRFRWEDYIASYSGWRSSERLATGVVCYARLEAVFPERDGIGLLGFADAPAQLDERFLPPIVTRVAKAVAYATSFGGIILGAALMAIFIRLKKSSRQRPI
jgi:hypothetical protein